MTRPSKYPRWADVSGGIVEPSSGHKDVGFSPGGKGIANYFDWLFNLTYQWIQHLDQGERVIWIPASKAATCNNTDQLTTTRGIFNSGASRIDSSNGFNTNYEFPLDMLIEGDRITEITLYGREGDSAGENYTGRLYSVDPATSVKTGISSLKTSGTTNANTTLQWTTADTGLTPDGYEVPADTPLVFSGDLKSTSADAEVHIHMLKLVVDKGDPA